MKLAEIGTLQEDAGPKLKQLRLAIKELGLSSKLKNLGAFNNDHLVERCVAAFNSGHTAYDVVEQLDGLVSNYKGVRDASSFTYHLGRLKKLAPDTIFSNSLLDHWIKSFSVVGAQALEIKELSAAAKSVLEVLAEMWVLTRSDTADPHLVTFAKANLRSLGITR
jgi:hypothetical protein